MEDQSEWTQTDRKTYTEMDTCCDKDTQETGAQRKEAQFGRENMKMSRNEGGLL